MGKRLIVLIVLLAINCASNAQTLGGSSVFGFLNVSPSPNLSALGNSNVSSFSNDLSLSYHNPALLRKENSKQLTANFTQFYADIKALHASTARYYAPLKTIFSAAVVYFNYGKSTSSDASGNTYGNFSANDYVAQVSASKQYLEHWFYGTTVKFIHSSYAQYRSSAIAADFGLNYFDSSRQLQIGFVAKNMGIQLQRYAGIPEDLPFDIQMGITKRLLGSPLQFSLTAQRLHQYNLTYNDTTFNNSNGIRKSSNDLTNNLFRHLIVATEILVSDKLQFSIGFNVLRRSELLIANSTNGLTGFSFGASYSIKKMHINFARSSYQQSNGINQFGLSVKL